MTGRWDSVFRRYQQFPLPRETPRATPGPQWPLAVASLTNLGCYANGSSILIPPAFGSYGTAGANIFRGMPYYNVDLSITKVSSSSGSVSPRSSARRPSISSTT